MIPVGIISGVEVSSGEVSRGGAGRAAAGVVRVAKQLHVQLGAKVIGFTKNISSTSGCQNTLAISSFKVE